MPETCLPGYTHQSQVHGSSSVHGLGLSFPGIPDFHWNAGISQRSLRHGPAHDVIYSILLPTKDVIRLMTGELRSYGVRVQPWGLKSMAYQHPRRTPFLLLYKNGTVSIILSFQGKIL